MQSLALLVKPVNICIVTPAAVRSRRGNRVTAERWRRILRELGHRVAIKPCYGGGKCDCLVALHALRSFSSIEHFAREHPDRPLIVALTGTDLYGDIHTDGNARKALELATRLIVLQPLGIEELPQNVRGKVRVIRQSASAPTRRSEPRRHVFEVCVLGHLRPVKDPFRTAMAVDLLPPTSRVRVVHVGEAMTAEMEALASEHTANNPRYHWMGELPRWKALRILARSRLLVLTSRMEGGANVISEAIAASRPVISSRIPGSVGLLGPDYPGYFPVGDTRRLASLLSRAEQDDVFHDLLKARCRELAPLVDPAREVESWNHLMTEVESGSNA